MLANDTWFYSAEKPEGHLFWAGEIPGPGWHASPADIPKGEPAATADELVAEAAPVAAEAKPEAVIAEPPKTPVKPRKKAAKK